MCFTYTSYLKEVQKGSGVEIFGTVGKLQKYTKRWIELDICRERIIVTPLPSAGFNVGGSMLMNGTTSQLYMLP